MEVLENPFRNYFNAYTFKSIVFVSLTYALVILMYYTSIRNYMMGKEYGTAQFADPKEVSKKLQDKNEQRNRIISQNVMMSYDARYMQRNLNLFIVGGSGSWKTLGCVQPNIMQLPFYVSFAITDPKTETLTKNGQMLIENGYSVKVLNLIDMEKSDGYNPFAYVRNETDIDKLITNFMKNTTPKGAQSAEPFWESATCS